MNNANMPKGRGMVKWTPFAAMPEQFAGIREIIKDKTKVERPTLTQDEHAPLLWLDRWASASSAF